MTDQDLVAKKLALVETYVHELRTLSSPGNIVREVRERRFVEHTLQIAIQAAIDVASHIVSDEKLGEPTTNSQLFDALAQAGWLRSTQSDQLRKMAGFRNLLVHGYAAVDPEIVREVVESHLDDLLEFVNAIRGRLGGAR
ncbi:MAG TPA: DUF86 domain-containing protein [Polyangia bacterium]|nr:DUF86 domain-containing protein [Polyangia bacterium]